jgi:hypothetical protein
VWLVGALQGLLPGRGIRRTCRLPVGFSRPAFGPGADATVAKTAPNSPEASEPPSTSPAMPGTTTDGTARETTGSAHTVDQENVSTTQA